MTKVKVTHIELKMEIGTGWAKTFNMFALCEPHEVKFQKNFPDHMRVEVSDFGSVRTSSRIYKLAKETSDQGKVDWTRSGWDKKINMGTPPNVYIKTDPVKLVNDSD